MKTLTLMLVTLSFFLAGCNTVVLSPSGDIASQQGRLVMIATGLMLLIIIPVIVLTLLFAWTGALFVFAWRFGRAVKRGFGRRWTLTLITWGALWVVAIFGTSWWFAGQTWFLIASAVALTVTAWVGAWAEASR